MKHVFRFFGKLTDQQSPFVWEITDDENHHLQKVIKLKVGDALEVQNLEGHWSKAIISEILKTKTIAHAMSVEKQSALSSSVHVVLGALKPADLDDVLPSLVELGVTKISLFLAGQDSKHRVSEKNQERWQRILLNAAKQCKRAGIPKLTSYNSLSDLLDKSNFTNEIKVVFDPSAKKSVSQLIPSEISQGLCIAIGSEAGFSEKEVKLLHSYGFQGVQCGPFILRGLTAAILAGSLGLSVLKS